MTSYSTIYQTAPINNYSSNTSTSHLPIISTPELDELIIPVPWRTKTGSIWMRETIRVDITQLGQYCHAINKDMAMENRRYYELNSVKKYHSFKNKMNEQKELEKFIEREREDKFKAFVGVVKLIATQKVPPSSTSSQSTSSPISSFKTTVSPRSSSRPSTSTLPLTKKVRKGVTWSPEIERTSSPDHLFENSSNQGQEVSPDTSIDIKFDRSNESDSQSEDSDTEMSNSSSNSSQLQVDSIYPSHYEARVAVSKYFHSTSQKYTITKVSTQTSTGLTTTEVLACHLSRRALMKVANQRSKIQRDYVEAEEKKHGINNFEGCNYLIKIISVDLMNSDGAWKVLEISGEHDHEEAEVGIWVEPKLLSKRGSNKEKERNQATSVRQHHMVERSTSPIPPKKRKLDSNHIFNSTSPPPQISRPASPSLAPTTSFIPPTGSSDCPPILNPTLSRLLTPKELTSFLFSLDKSLIFHSSTLYEAGLRSLESLISFVSMEDIERDIILKGLGIDDDGRKILARLK